MDLSAKTGDVWIDRAGNEIEWMFTPSAGDKITTKSVTVNGKDPVFGTKIPFMIKHSLWRTRHGYQFASPGEDVTVFRDRVCIQDGGMLADV